MPAEFPPGVELLPVLAEGALAALDAGDRRRTTGWWPTPRSGAAATGCDVIALAQFSLARAAPAVEHAVPVPVCTTPASAVRRLRARLGHGPA